MAGSVLDIEDMGKTCGCADCAALCSTVPGHLTPADAKRLQDHLGGPAELLDHTVFEIVQRGGHSGAVLRPKVVGEKAGGAFGALLPGCGACVFLDKEKGCKLTYKTGKPTGCRSVYGCGDDSRGRDNDAAAVSWDTPEAAAYIGELDAHATTGVPFKQALAERSEQMGESDTPYGILAAKVHAVRIQSARFREVSRLSKRWTGPHPSTRTGEPTATQQVASEHRAYVIDTLKEECRGFHTTVDGLHEDRCRLVEEGRKRVRLTILNLLLAIDTDMVATGAIELDGDFLYIMRAWIQTLTRQ